MSSLSNTTVIHIDIGSSLDVYARFNAERHGTAFDLAFEFIDAAFQLEEPLYECFNVHISCHTYPVLDISSRGI